MAVDTHTSPSRMRSIVEPREGWREKKTKPPVEACGRTHGTDQHQADPVGFGGDGKYLGLCVRGQLEEPAQHSVAMRDVARLALLLALCRAFRSRKRPSTAPTPPALPSCKAAALFAKGRTLVWNMAIT